jgi:hypothetical protein
MIDRTHVLPVSRQPKLLGVSRSSVYYQPRPVSDADLALMRASTNCIWRIRLPAHACWYACCGARTLWLGASR